MKGGDGGTMSVICLFSSTLCCFICKVLVLEALHGDGDIYIVLCALEVPPRLVSSLQCAGEHSLCQKVSGGRLLLSYHPTQPDFFCALRWKGTLFMVFHYI